MQEATLTALLGMAARGAAAVSAPELSRPAEEIARETITQRTWLGIDDVWFSHESTRLARVELARIIAQARADGAAAALAGQQPRDLAGRIRALIQEYAGRWADAEPRSIERRAATGVMDDLCRALDDVRTGTGRPLTWWIELLRHPSGSMDPTIRAHRSLAADELAAIVRVGEPPGAR